MKDEKSEIAAALTEIGVNQLDFHDPRLFRDLLGQHDQHVKILQNTLQVKIRVRGSAMEIEGDPLQVELASQILRQLYSLLEKGYPVYASDVDYAIRILSGDNRARLQDIFLDTIYISAHKRTITPKSIAQKAYIDAIRRYDIVFGIGPAGTGKTYLAMAMAVAELMKNNYVQNYFNPPGRRSRRKTGLLARRSGGKSESLFASVIRRAARHGRFRPRPQAGRTRHHRSRAAGVHARPNLE